MVNINTKEYWDSRFALGDWETKGGFNQTKLFAIEQARYIKPYVSPGCRILDFGCGAGDSSEIFVSEFPDCNFYGEDLSQAAIQLAEERFGHLGKFSTKLKDEMEFDIIFTSNVLEHVPDYKSICDELLLKCRYLFVFVPFNERPLSKEHVRTFFTNSFDDYNPIFTQIYLSKGWSYFGFSYLWNIIIKNVIRPFFGKQLKHQNRQIVFVLKGALGD